MHNHISQRVYPVCLVYHALAISRYNTTTCRQFCIMPPLFLLWCFTSRIVFVVGYGILPYIGWWRYIQSQNYWLAYTSAWLPPIMSLTLWPTNQWIYIINNIFDNELQAKAHVFLFYCVSFDIKITWMTLQSTWFTFKHYVYVTHYSLVLPMISPI